MDRHLEVFVMVAEKESFSKAAEAEHMTQPAVSQYIRAFEEMMGMKLLDRTNKYVRLNKAGEIVYYYAKEILGLYTKMENQLADLQDKASGTLTIGASYTFGEYVLPRVLALLIKQYPDIEPTVTIGNTKRIEELVRKHQLDIGIVEGEVEQQDLFSEVFAVDEMFLVAAKNHELTKGNLTREDLLNATWVIRESGSGTREAADKLFSKLKLKAKKQMHFSSTQSIKEAVLAGLGISLLSKWAIQKELKYGELVVLKQEELPCKRNFSLLTNTKYETKALQLLKLALREIN